MGKVESYILKKRIVSANRRRKRAEKTLKRVRKESTASIKHWRKSAEYWQRQAYEYAMKYSSLLGETKPNKTEERLRISAKFFSYQMQRAMTVPIPTGNTNPNTLYNGFFSQIEEQKRKKKDENI